MKSYEPTLKTPPTEDQLIFRGFVVAVIGFVAICGTIAGCEIATNTDDEQIKACHERGGNWTWAADDSGDKLTNSKTCVITTEE